MCYINHSAKVSPVFMLKSCFGCANANCLVKNEGELQKKQTQTFRFVQRVNSNSLPGVTNHYQIGNFSLSSSSEVVVKELIQSLI